MRDYAIVFPDHFDEEAGIIESKGRCDIKVFVGADRYDLEFYEPVRHAQTIESELQSRGISVVQDVVVIPAVTRQAIEDAVRQLAQEDFQALRRAQA